MRNVLGYPREMCSVWPTLFQNCGSYSPQPLKARSITTAFKLILTMRFESICESANDIIKPFITLFHFHLLISLWMTTESDSDSTLILREFDPTVSKSVHLCTRYTHCTSWCIQMNNTQIREIFHAELQNRAMAWSGELANHAIFYFIVFTWFVPNL